MDSGFQLLDSSSFSVEFGLRIPIVCEIPDSYSCILGSKVQDSTWIPQVKLSKIPDSTSRIFLFPKSGFPYLGRFLYTYSTAALLSCVDTFHFVYEIFIV